MTVTYRTSSAVECLKVLPLTLTQANVRSNLVCFYFASVAWTYKDFEYDAETVCGWHIKWKKPVKGYRANIFA